MDKSVSEILEIGSPLSWCCFTCGNVIRDNEDYLIEQAKPERYVMMFCEKCGLIRKESEGLNSMGGSV